MSNCVTKPRPPGAERRSDGKLLFARGSAGEQKICDVGAGNQKHERNGAQQNDRAGRSLPTSCSFTGTMYMPKPFGLLPAIAAGMRRSPQIRCEARQPRPKPCAENVRRNLQTSYGREDSGSRDAGFARFSPKRKSRGACLPPRENCLAAETPTTW